MTKGRVRGRRMLPAAAAAAALAGCAAAVVVEPAPMASDPVCALVLQAAPDSLGGLPRRSTTSQASLAWGREEPVVLRCGVTPPGPTTDRCLRVTGAGGEAVDWVVREGDDRWTFVTYGRSPAVEVSVPVAGGRGEGTGTAPLVDLAPAVSRTAVQRSCL